MPTKGKFNWSRCCLFSVEFEATGARGGDAGHGGYTQITFRDIAGTCMEIAPEEGLEPEQTSSFVIRFRGDDETLGLAEAFLSIGRQLYELEHSEEHPDYLDYLEEVAERHFSEAVQ
jgi:hypothetical protein